MIDVSMQKIKNYVFWFLISVFLSGCSCVGYPITFNPAKKLQYAQSLIEAEERPLPAEPMIFEAIETYKKRGDEVGLAHAYRMYAIFLKSQAVGKWNYAKYGFIDKSITFENRYDGALKYYEKALCVFKKHELYAFVSNIYFNMAIIYYDPLRDRHSACTYLNQSLTEHEKYRAQGGGAVELLPGYDNFKDIIDWAKEEVGCR